MRQARAVHHRMLGAGTWGPDGSAWPDTAPVTTQPDEDTASPRALASWTVCHLLGPYSPMFEVRLGFDRLAREAGLSDAQLLRFHLENETMQVCGACLYVKHHLPSDFYRRYLAAVGSRLARAQSRPDGTAELQRVVDRYVDLARANAPEEIALTYLQRAAGDGEQKSALLHLGELGHVALELIGHGYEETRRAVVAGEEFPEPPPSAPMPL